jgi:hypothetical protein
MEFKTQEELRKEFDLIIDKLLEHLFNIGENFKNKQQQIVDEMNKNGFYKQAKEVEKEMSVWYEKYQRFIDRIKNERFIEYSKGYSEFQNQITLLAETMNIIIEKPGLTLEQIKAFTSEFDTFWKDTYKQWGHDTSSMTFTPEFTPPTAINFTEFSEQPDDTKEFGRYLTNPETAFLDYETLGEPFIFDPNTDQGYQNWLIQHNRTKGVASVMDYVHETYAGTHHLPGIEYQKYLFENPDKVPQSMKDGNLYYFPGTAFRSSGGLWHAPYGYWDGGVCYRDGYGVRIGWNSRKRVVLFGK